MNSIQKLLVEIGFPFDFEYYQKMNPELMNMPRPIVAHHASLYAEANGKTVSEFHIPQKLIDFVNEKITNYNLRALEIGPFDNPALVGGVKYFDVLNSEKLRERAVKENRPFNKVPNKIDFVDPNGDLSIIPDKYFDIVFSSHCIEHQVDFISHLQKVSTILNKEGVYVMKIPDKRYMFDHFLAETNLAEIINAYHDKRKFHTYQSVLEHRMLVTHNDGVRHWLGLHGDDRFSKECFEAAEQEFKVNNEKYIDVHSWHFTPNSFYNLIQKLNKLGFTDLVPYSIFHTLWGNIEFTAILKKEESVRTSYKIVICDEINGFIDEIFPITIGIEYLYLRGWNICTSDIGKEAERVIVFRYNDGSCSCFPLKQIERQDIVNLYNDESHRMAGFCCFIERKKILENKSVDILVGYKVRTNVFCKKLAGECIYKKSS